MPDSGLVYACVTHVPLWLEPPSWVTPIYLGEAQAAGLWNLRDLAPDWEAHHPVLGGTAGSFAIKNYLLRHRPDATRIGICQYRKFVSPRRIVRAPAPNYRVMDLVPLDALRGGALGDFLDPGDRSFLLCAPLHFTRLFWHRRGYLRDYVGAHHVEDLLRFCAEAVEQGVIASREVEPFLKEDVFIPGGVELGVYPVDFWLASIGAVEQVVRACVQRYTRLRSGYQTRAWAFCAERLGSWLLLKRLRIDSSTNVLYRHTPGWTERIWTRNCVGQLNLITREESRYIVGT